MFVGSPCGFGHFGSVISVRDAKVRVETVLDGSWEGAETALREFVNIAERCGEQVVFFRASGEGSGAELGARGAGKLVFDGKTHFTEAERRICPDDRISTGAQPGAAFPARLRNVHAVSQAT